MVANGSQQTLAKDTKIGKYHFKAGDIVQINILGLHQHKGYWQNPERFEPDRFDSTSPLSLAPNGKKRHTFAYLPFYGGRRVCFGKTFAEANLKILASYMT